MTDIREKVLNNMFGNLAQNMGTPDFKERIAEAEAKRKLEQLRIAKAEAKRLRKANRGAK